MKEPEVVIIGAGLAGLTAAALLSQAGMAVAIVEEAPDVGGRLRGLSREGYWFDAGFPCLRHSEVEVLEDLNQRLDLGLSFLRSEKPGWLVVGGELIPLSAATSPGGVEGEKLSRGEKEALAAFASKLGEAKPGQWMRRSVAEFLAAADLEGEEVVEDYAGALGLLLWGRTLKDTSAGILIREAQASGLPDFHLQAVTSGPDKLVSALAGKLKPTQVRLVLGSRVQSLEIAHGRVTQVITSSDSFSPHAVIYTGPPQVLPALLPQEALPSKLASQCARLRPVSALSLELALSRRVSEEEGVLVEPREGVLARFPSNLDPSLAPAAGQLSSWLMLVPEEDLEDAKTARSHLLRLRRLMKRHFPAIFEHVRLERLRIMPAFSCTAPLPRQADKIIPPVIPEIRGLFLAGHGLRPENASLTAAAVSSAGEVVGQLEEFFSHGR